MQSNADMYSCNYLSIRKITKSLAGRLNDNGSLTPSWASDRFAPGSGAARCGAATNSSRKLPATNTAFVAVALLRIGPRGFDPEVFVYRPGNRTIVSFARLVRAQAEPSRWIAMRSRFASEARMLMGLPGLRHDDRCSVCVPAITLQLPPTSLRATWLSTPTALGFP